MCIPGIGICSKVSESLGDLYRFLKLPKVRLNKDRVKNP
jgi:hypothetical protein